MAKKDLSPGCGTVITEKVGNHTVTLEFNSNAEEAKEARRKMVEVLSKGKDGAA